MNNNQDSHDSSKNHQTPSHNPTSQAIDCSGNRYKEEDLSSRSDYQTDAAELMARIDENNSLYDDSQDDSTKAVIITFCPVNFTKLYNYSTEKGFRVIKYFGLPQKTSINNLTQFLNRLIYGQNLQVQNLILVVDNLDSFSCIYSYFPELDEFISMGKIEIHLPFEELIIKHGEVNHKTMQWYLLSNLARFLSFNPPKIELNPDTEERVYEAVDKKIMQKLKISSEQEDKILRIIDKAIDYAIEEHQEKAVAYYDLLKSVGEIALRNLRSFVRDNSSRDEYYNSQPNTAKALSLIIFTLRTEQQTISNFSEAILSMLNISANGNQIFTNAMPLKQQKIINLVFTKLKMVNGRLDYTLHPVFSLLVKK